MNFTVMIDMVRTLNEAADRVDAVGQTMPNVVNAGPFAAEVEAIVGPIVTNQLELVVRLKLAAAMLLLTILNSLSVEAANAALVGNVERLMEDL